MAEPAEISVPDLVLYVVVVLFPMVAFWATIAVYRVGRKIVEHFSRPEVVAHGPPIEQLAADLRRVHCILRQLAPGTPIVRWRATRQAYDALLMQACAAVEVGHRLDELPPEGFEREMERLRIEEALRSAGLVVP